MPVVRLAQERGGYPIAVVVVKNLSGFELDKNTFDLHVHIHHSCLGATEAAIRPGHILIDLHDLNTPWFEIKSSGEILCVANCYSSCYRELMNPSAVSVPTEIIQLDWKFGHNASDFCRRLTTK